MSAKHARRGENLQNLQTNLLSFTERATSSYLKGEVFAVSEIFELASF